ncbi:MAG: hypothetical protein LRY71_08405 [Bacillaceae bacterium]|nr:hypothetical protein [Bacillaceae bacterium]
MDTKDIVFSFFKDRTAVLATMHHKEIVIEPIIDKKLGVKLIVPNNFNTDRFGTFTRDVERMGDQLEAARHKANEAMLLTGCQIGIASEGSFGPHPYFPFISLNKEIIVLIDKENDLEIIGTHSSTETNFNEKVVRDFNEAYEFALTCGFPQHGIIVRCGEKLIKGISDKEQLKQSVEYMLCEYKNSEVKLETDMRAMYNPTRMRNIKAAMEDLVDKLYYICPACSFPGFSLVERKKGLPCSLCGLPTELVLTEIYHCKKCGTSEESLYPRGVKNG